MKRRAGVIETLQRPVPLPEALVMCISHSLIFSDASRAIDVVLFFYLLIYLCNFTYPVVCRLSPNATPHRFYLCQPRLKVAVGKSDNWREGGREQARQTTKKKKMKKPGTESYVMKINDGEGRDKDVRR